MPAKLFGCLGMTIAPAKVPRCLIRFQLDARPRHFHSLVDILKARFVGEKLAVTYALLALSLAIDIPKVPVIEELSTVFVNQVAFVLFGWLTHRYGCPVLHGIADNDGCTTICILCLECGGTKVAEAWHAIDVGTEITPFWRSQCITQRAWQFQGTALEACQKVRECCAYAIHFLAHLPLQLRLVVVQ